MSNDWVPKQFNDMAKKGTVKDVDRAAEDLLASVDSTFKPLGVDAGIEKRTMVRKVVNEELCPKCNKPLEGRVAVAMEKKYHIQCFCCSQCDRPIEEGFTIKKGQVWCPKCVEWTEEKPLAKSGAKPAAAGAGKGDVKLNKSAEAKDSAADLSDVDPMRGFKAKVCAKCNHNINVGLDYNGQSYCAECFTCSRCKAPIDVTQGFLPQGNKVFCALCAHAATGPTVEQAPVSHKCASCGGQIDGKFVKVDGKMHHKECFQCSSCGGSLAEGYAVKGKKKFCPNCANANGDVIAEVVPLDTPINGLVLDSYSGTVTENKPQHTLLKDAQATKFCFNCGFKCEGKKFCPGCGSKVE